MNNEKITIVSDVHLDQRVPERQKRFQQFLESVLPDTDRLIILGDLFEFWFGYKSVIFHYYFPILNLLWKFHQQGKTIQYVAGNHDFSMGTFFQNTLEIEIFEKGFEEVISGNRFYLCHGDCINPKDYGYRLLHRITRHYFTVSLFSIIPPDIGIFLALKLSDLSRSYTHNRDVVPRTCVESFFKNKLAEGFSGLIFGHTHKPEYTETEWNGKKVFLINTGDWINHSSYLVIENGIIKLQEYSESKK